MLLVIVDSNVHDMMAVSSYYESRTAIPVVVALTALGLFAAGLRILMDLVALPKLSEVTELPKDIWTSLIYLSVVTIVAMITDSKALIRMFYGVDCCTMKPKENAIAEILGLRQSSQTARVLSFSVVSLNWAAAQFVVFAIVKLSVVNPVSNYKEVHVPTVETAYDLMTGELQLNSFLRKGSLQSHWEALFGLVCLFHLANTFAISVVYKMNFHPKQLARKYGPHLLAILCLATFSGFLAPGGRLVLICMGMGHVLVLGGAATIRQRNVRKAQPPADPNLLNALQHEPLLQVVAKDGSSASVSQKLKDSALAFFELYKVPEITSRVRAHRVKLLGFLIVLMLGLLVFCTVVPPQDQQKQVLRGKYRLDDQTVNLVEVPQEKESSNAFSSFLRTIARAVHSIRPPPALTFRDVVGCCETLGFDLSDTSSRSSSSSTSMPKSDQRQAKDKSAKNPNPFASIASSPFHGIISKISPPPALTFSDLVGCCEAAVGFDLNDVGSQSFSSSSSASVSKSSQRQVKDPAAEQPNPFASIASSPIHSIISKLSPPPALTLRDVVGCCEAIGLSPNAVASQSSSSTSTSESFQQQAKDRPASPFASIFSSPFHGISKFSPPPALTLRDVVGCCEALGLDTNDVDSQSSSSSPVSKSFPRQAQEPPANPFASIISSPFHTIMSKIRSPQALTFNDLVGCCEVGGFNLQDLSSSLKKQP